MRTVRGHHRVGVAAAATAVLVAACGSTAPASTGSTISTPIPTTTSTTPTPQDTPTATPPTLADPTGPTAASLADVDDCPALHDTVLDWLDRAAARARALQPDGDALGLLMGHAVEGEVPEGLEAYGGVLPSRPYGGVAGEAAAERYEALGCTPDDEFPALLAWFGLPPDTELRADDGPLETAGVERVRADGAGGFVALALARRLTEGAERSDSLLMRTLADVAAALEAHREAHGTYTEDLEDLRPHLRDPSILDWDHMAADWPLVTISKATTDAYCVHGADLGPAVVESHDGVPRNRAPGTPSCPNTFPDIDD